METLQQGDRESSVPSIIRQVPESVEYLTRNKASRRRTKSQIFDLAAGESPFGIMPAYDKIVRKLVDSGAYTAASAQYGAGGDVEPAIRFLRRWHGIGRRPYITFDPRGSDGILKSIILELILDPHVRPAKIVSIGPTYPHIVNFANLYGLDTQGHPILPYESFPNPLEEKKPYVDTLKLAGEALRKELTDLDIELLGSQAGRNEQSQASEANISDENDSRLLYLCNPSTPTGEMVPLDIMESIILASTKNKKDLVVVDEAFLYERSNSAIPLTEEVENLSVLGTLSKSGGISGQRIGFVVMSEGIGRVYDKTRLIYDIPGPLKLIINEIFKNNVLIPHIRRLVKKTRRIKRIFLSALTSNGITYFPTSSTVPIQFVDGKRPDFYQRLRDRDVLTAPGVGFAETHPELKALGEGANRYVRVRLPGNEKDIPEIANRFADAAFGS